ncbi:hypothetical protein D3C86_1129410 [compost metagenome]
MTDHREKVALELVERSQLRDGGFERALGLLQRGGARGHLALEARVGLAQVPGEPLQRSHHPGQRVVQPPDLGDAQHLAARRRQLEDAPRDLLGPLLQLGQRAREGAREPDPDPEPEQQRQNPRPRQDRQGRVPALGDGAPRLHELLAVVSHQGARRLREAVVRHQRLGGVQAIGHRDLALGEALADLSIDRDEGPVRLVDVGEVATLDGGVRDGLGALVVALELLARPIELGHGARALRRGLCLEEVGVLQGLQVARQRQQLLARDDRGQGLVERSVRGAGREGARGDRQRQERREDGEHRAVAEEDAGLYAHGASESPGTPYCA